MHSNKPYSLEADRDHGRAHRTRAIATAVELTLLAMLVAAVIVFATR